MTLIPSRIDRVVQPVTKRGIDFLEVREGEEVIDKIEKPDVPDRVYESSRQSETSEVLTDTREALLKVTKPNLYDKKGKWGFSDGAAKFSADLNDAGYFEKARQTRSGVFQGR